MIKNIKSLKRLVTAVISICMLVSLFSFSAAAAQARISFSDPSATVGSNVSVSVSISAAVSGVDFYLSYNTSYLEYVSASGGVGNLNVSGGGGSLHVFDYYGSGSGSFSATLTFKTLATGSTTIYSATGDIVDGNGDNYDVTYGTSTLTINPVPTASSDATLKALSISPGSLSPAFSASTLSYTASIGGDVTKVAVSATKNDSGAKVSVSGNSNLSVGKNTVSVKVTAADGSVKTYKIVVTRATPTNTPSPSSDVSASPEPEVLYIQTTSGSDLQVGEFEDTAIPLGFTRTIMTYENQEIGAVMYSETGTLAVYLLGNGTLPDGFYFFDSETSMASPMTILSASVAKYTVLDPTEDMLPPDGYEVVSVDLGSGNVKVYAPVGDTSPDHYILYVMCENGTAGLYMYDVAEKTMQRYGLGSADDEAEATPSPEPTAEPVKTGSSLLDDVSFLQTAIIAVGVLLLALLAVVIILGIILGKKNRLLNGYFDSANLGASDESVDEDVSDKVVISEEEFDIESLMNEYSDKKK